MKKKNILESFKDKKFKYGGYATLMTAVVIAVLVVINLLVDQISFNIDLTQNKMFSLSDQTYKILDNLDQDVTIYGLYQAGKENPTVDEILKRYAARSKRISVKYKDPVLYPQFVKKYDKEGEGIREGSLIVESGDKFKVIDRWDLVNYSYSDPYNPTAESLAVEQKVTNAILYVTSDKNPTVYVLKGHDEGSIPYDVQKQMEDENYDIKELDLLKEEAVPDDADTLLVISPARDLSEEEDKKIREYLAEGGRAVFLMDVLDKELPNFQALLKSYGVTVKPAVVVEGDGNYHLIRNPVWLLPKMESHDIVSPVKLNDMNILIPASQVIEQQEIKKRTIEIEPLLVTSDKAWAKTNLNSTTLEKESGDLEGPFTLAVAITNKVYEPKEIETKLVVIANSAFLLDSRAVALSNGANIDFFINAVNWLQDEKESLYIRPKSLRVRALRINQTQQLVFSGIVVILIPVIVLGTGLIVWLRRRHL